MSDLLFGQLKTLEFYIEKENGDNPSISQVSTYWHIDHSLQVLLQVINYLNNSITKDYKPRFSIIKWLIMTTRYIPRGKGRAPQQTVPKLKSTQNELKILLDKAKSAVQTIGSVPENKNFKHPYFGYLNKKETLKFLEIHTNHHLKIIKDIAGQAN
jgi:hypothetical protein